MLLEMICTGEEVLSGQITDTNAAWFGNTMMNLGIELQQRTTVGDRMEDLVRIFQERSQQADVILVNGGLGPTSDDLSAEAVALACGVELVENTAWRDHLESWFSSRKRVMPKSNLKQCLLPEGAVLVDNPIGSAPGFRVRLNRAWLFFTPGVPTEFKRMVEEQFVPFVQTTFQQGTATRLHKFLTVGHGESTLADQIADIALPEGITLGYRPSAPIVEIKVFARGEPAIARLPPLLAHILTRLDTAIVSERFGSIAEEVHHLLLDTNSTLSLAESCSGGMLSSLLIDFAGSSAYLLHSVVSYSNASKQTMLKVPESVLATHGAVSTETAIAMARGARAILDSDYALAITGIAGPDGGTEAKPVGTVAIALTTRTTTWVQMVSLGNRSRLLVRTMSCAVALDMLRRCLLQQQVIVPYPFIPASQGRQESCH